jgi:hypothetical protein
MRAKVCLIIEFRWFEDVRLISVHSLMRAEVKKKINNFSLSVVDKTLIFYFDQFNLYQNKLNLEIFKVNRQQNVKAHNRIVIKMWA